MERQNILPGRLRRKSGSGHTRPIFFLVKGDKKAVCGELVLTGSEMTDKTLINVKSTWSLWK